MALQKQNVPISFAGGLDTKTDDKQVIPGKLLTLENGVFTSPKKIRKRNGYNALPTSIEGGLLNIGAGVALATFKNELIEFSGTKLYSFSESTQRWSDKGAASNLSLSSIPIVRNTYQQTTPDSAFHPSGLTVHAWEDNRGGSRYSVIDSSTGEYIVADVLISSTAHKPKPFSLGNFVVIIYYDSADIRMLPLPIVSPSIPQSIITITTGIDTSHPHFDVDTDGTRLFIAYNLSGGNIGLKSINAFLTVSSPLIVLGESASSCISISVDGSNSQIWVAYHNGTQVKYFVRDHSLSAIPILTPTLVESNSNTILNITLLAFNGISPILYTQKALIPSNSFIKSATLTNSGSVTGLSIFLRSVGIAGKLFSYNGVSYVTTAFESTLQSTYFVINLADKSVIAKFSPDLGGGLPTTSAVPEAVPAVSGSFIIPSLQKDLLTTESGTVYTQTGVQAITLNFSSSGAFQSAELGENLQVTGGILYMYDGISLTEHGFNIFPENISNVTSGGGSISAGTRQYAITYEWADNQGQTHYSAPSVPLTVINAGPTDTNTLTIPTLRITDKQPLYGRAPVIIGVYRTVDVGTTFYKISSLTSPLFNDTSVDTVTFVDTQDDPAIIGNPLLYTTGSVLENIAAPACSYVTTYKDRIILLPEEDTNQWWFSKQVVPGSPVEFSDLLVKNVDQMGGRLVSAVQMDSELILLKETQLYYVTGTGPDSTGAQDDFSPAQPIVSDGGCVDKKSVVLTPMGLMYKSQKGIYQLSRKLETSYIGAPVEEFNSAKVISASLVPNTTQVRFCLDSGIALMFDYLVQEWSVFTNHDSVDALIFQGEFTYLRPTGVVMQESPGKFTDDTAFIKMRLVMSWLSLAGLQAFERVYKILLLGSYYSPHNLLVQVAYDFNPFFTQSTTIPAGSLLLQSPPYGGDTHYGDSTPYGGAFPSYFWRVPLARQKCSAVQFSIEDTQMSGFGQNYDISGISLEVGVKKGLNKLPASSTFG